MEFETARSGRANGGLPNTSLVGRLENLGIQSLFIAVLLEEEHPTKDPIHTAFSGHGQNFMMRNNLVQKFLNYCRDDNTDDELNSLQFDNAESSLKKAKENGKLSIESGRSSKLGNLLSGCQEISRKSNKWHKCVVCQKRFRESRTLNRHMQVHLHDKMGSQCKQCDERFQSAAQLEMHICMEKNTPLDVEKSLNIRGIATETEKHLCKVCNEGFKRKSRLKEHMLTHDSKQVITDSSELQNNHYNLGLEEKLDLMYICSSCDQFFDSDSQLTFHMLSHGSGDDKNDDKVDGSENRNVRAHIAEISDEQQFKEDPIADILTLCQQKLEVEESMEADEDQEESYVSSVCDFERNRCREATVHDENNRAIYTQPACNVEFRDRNQYYQHLSNLHGDSNTETKLDCWFCSQVFRTSEQLESHMLTHAGSNTSNECDVLQVEKTRVLTFRNDDDDDDDKNSTKEFSGGKFACRFCCKQLKKRSLLEDHESKCWSSGGFKTENEACVMPADLELVKDYDLLTSEETLCNMCGKTFDTSTDLSQHISTDHAYEFGVGNDSSLSDQRDERKFSCSFCGKRFKRGSHVKEHEMIHKLQETGIAKYECLACKRQFIHKGHYNAHLETHPELRGDKARIKKLATGKRKSEKVSYYCLLCEKLYFHKHQYTMHMRTHSGEKPYACTVCEKRFVSKAHVRRHTQSVHREKQSNGTTDRGGDAEIKRESYDGCEFNSETNDEIERKFQCSYCSKRFKRRGHLTEHHLRHKLQKSGERPELCMVCGKRFFTVHCLKVHMKSHSDGKPFKCDSCMKTYGSMILLKMHMKFHTSERAFSCHVCGKCFISNYKLKIHMCIHSGDRPYVCDTCGKRYVTRGDMNKCVRRHNRIPGQIIDRILKNDRDKNKHWCDICNKQFACAANLRSHLRIHTKEKPYVCDLCKRAFAHKPSFNRHMKLHFKRYPMYTNTAC